MATQLETVGGLGRKLAMAVVLSDIEREVGDRLRKLARTVKMPGFRPGKVPMRMIEQSYGAQVQSEVLGDAVSKAFSDAVAEHSLRVAGRAEARSRPASKTLRAVVAFAAQGASRRSFTPSVSAKSISAKARSRR